MRLPEFIRTTTFRWTLVVSGAFTLCILLMFAFVLAQAHSYMTVDVDGLNAGIADSVIEKDGPERRVERLDEYLRVDPHGVKLGGLFSADGTRVAGNIESCAPGAQGGRRAAARLIGQDRWRERTAQRPRRWRAEPRKAGPWSSAAPTTRSRGLSAAWNALWRWA